MPLKAAAKGGGHPGGSKPGQSLPIRGKDDKSKIAPTGSGSKAPGKKPAPTSGASLTPSPVPSIAASEAPSRSESPARSTTASEVGNKASAQPSSQGRSQPPKLGYRNPEYNSEDPDSGPKFFHADDPRRHGNLGRNTRKHLSFSPATTQHGSSSVSRTSSPHSEPTFNRKARPKWISKTHIDLREIVDVGEQPPRDISRVALMLGTGQGGTFSYGSKFKNKNSKGETEDLLDVDALQIGSTKVRHLRSYGNGVHFVGTSGCISCIGIYFELKGNRCFCAHVNAWMAEYDYHHILLTGDPEYYNIKDQFVKKMRAHGIEHGWGPDDYVHPTLRLVSPHPHVLGYAIQDALAEFLGLPGRPTTQPAHGFLMLPKRKTKQGNPMGRMLKVTWDYERRGEDDAGDDDFEQGFHAEDVPDNFKTVEYKEADGDLVDDEWTFTAYCGWHVTGPDGSVAYMNYSDEP